MSGDQSKHHSSGEIIIVKRRRGGEHGHHGGAWKIAYADFMTAMMAFFLVMWLIHASNDETKAAVASYFNPIRLTDVRPADRGLRELDQSTNGEVVEKTNVTQDGGGYSAGPKTGGGDHPDSLVGEETKYSDAAFFENPYSVLSEIVLETGLKSNISSAGEGGANTSGPATGASGGEAYRDPFDPDFWSKAVENYVDSRMAGDDVAGEDGSDGQRTQGSDGEVGSDVGLQTEAADAGQPDDREDPPETPESDDASAPEPDGRLTAEMVQASRLRSEIDSALRARDIELADGMSVVPAEGGLLISLTGELKGGMFNVGSAVPKRTLVLAMEEVGRLLAQRGGSVEIRGHTDARPFAGTDEDNWTLSMARARSAYFMLVRGGLAEQRIESVSGFADRRLKIKDRPLSDANRRIEILVRQSEGQRL